MRLTLRLKLYKPITRNLQNMCTNSVVDEVYGMLYSFSESTKEIKNKMAPLCNMLQSVFLGLLGRGNRGVEKTT